MNLFIPITKIDAAQRLVYGRLTQEVVDKSGEILDYESSKPAFQKWSDEQFKASGGKSKGNLRAMHDKIAAGIFTDIVFDDDSKSIEGCAKVVDDTEWEKVEAGVYTGFSIGGGYAKRWTDPENPKLKRYTPELAEVSLVDNPCVPTATFEFIKEDGSTELRKFNTNEEAPMTKTTQNDTAADELTDDVAKDAAATDAAAADQEAAEATTDTVEKAADAPAEQPADRPQDKGGVVQGFMAKDGTFHIRKADALKRNIQVDAEAIAAPALEAVKNLTEAVSKAETGDDKPTEAAKQAPSPDPAPTEDPKPEAEKAAPVEGVKKGMYDVCRFADLLQSILYLQQDTQWEAQWEGDNSELPAKLKAWLADGGTLLVQMVGEETAELTATKAAALLELAKKGAKLSAASKDHIEKMMKSAAAHLDEMGKCYKALGMESADDEGDEAAEKNTGVAIENATLKKILGDLTPQIEALTKRIEGQQAEIKKLSDQPLPPKGVLRAIDKGEDSGNVSDGDAVKKAADLLKGLSPEEQSMVLMKAALSKPQPITRN